MRIENIFFYDYFSRRYEYAFKLTLSINHLKNDKFSLLNFHSASSLP